MHQKERYTRRHEIDLKLFLNGLDRDTKGWFYRMRLPAPGLRARQPPLLLNLNGDLALQPKDLNSVVTAV